MQVVAVAKIVVVGAPGAGTTTFVRAASEIAPLDTDVVTRAGRRPGATSSTGSCRARATKRTSTVGFDFGRVTLPSGLALVLFGLPGRPAGGHLWTAAAAGCGGVVILVDGGRPEGGASLVARARQLAVPWMVAVNRPAGDRADGTEDGVENGAENDPAGAPDRAGVPLAGPGEPGRMLGAGPDVPVVSCDARSRESTRACLGVLVGLLRTRLQTRRAGPPAGLDERDGLDRRSGLRPDWLDWLDGRGGRNDRGRNDRGRNDGGRQRTADVERPGRVA